MKTLFFCICLIFLSWFNPIDWNDVINDFGKKFDYTRFSRKVLLIREDYQNGIFDSTIIKSKNLKKSAWAKINSVIGVCDYIASKDSSSGNSFFIWSDKAVPKFWVRYDADNKIRTIKTIRPKVSMHSIPPPCGY